MRRRFSRPVVAAGLVLATLLALAAPAAADEITIREIDASAFPEVTVSAIIDGDAPDLGDFQLRENGKLLDDFDVIPIGETAQPVGIVLLIDVSGSMNNGGALDQAKAAAREFIDNRLANDRIAVVAFGSDAKVVSNFTSDIGFLASAIDGLVASGETALFDGIRVASALFVDAPDLQPNIVVLSDGADTASTTSAREAEGAALDAKATVFSIGIETPDFDPSAVRRIANATGGAYVAAAEPGAIATAYASVQATLQNQYEIRWTSAATSGSLEVTVSAPGVQDSGQTTFGAVSSGANTEPEVVAGSSAPDFLSGSFGKTLGVGLALIAVALLVFVIILLFVRERTVMEEALAMYDDTGDGDADEDRFGGSFVDTAAGFAEEFASRQGFQPRVEELLEQANLPIRAGEALTAYVGIVVASGGLGLLLTRSLLGALVLLILGVLIPPAVLRFLASRRRKKFMTLLPDMLQLLSGSLRAGYSLMQGVEAVAQEIEDPAGYELRRIIAESRLGKPLEDALDDAALRMQSDDFGWAVMAIKIQREVGGNLAELLDTVAQTMIERERLRRDVAALTAEGRISAIILGMLPLGMGLILYFLNSEFISVLFDETLGQVMLGGSIVMAGLGFMWLKNIVDIEI